jgi:phenylpyruvate tautomerase PptA (4-oxalocrotonate tautomerase family)
MPMIDVHAATGTFSDKHGLAQSLASAVMRWEKFPPINLFKNNTAAFIHELPAESISNAAGESNYVRVQVLTPVGVLEREKQLGVVRELTDLVTAEQKPTLSKRTWVLITESPEGGWGINGHAYTSADIVASARAEIAGGDKGKRARQVPRPSRATSSDRKTVFERRAIRFTFYGATSLWLMTNSCRLVTTARRPS